MCRFALGPLACCNLLRYLIYRCSQHYNATVEVVALLRRREDALIETRYDISERYYREKVLSFGRRRSRVASQVLGRRIAFLPGFPAIIMEEWPIEISLHIVQYLNVTDMAKMCRQSRRWYYIIRQYQLHRGTQCVSLASYRPDRSSPSSSPFQLTSSEMYDQSLSQLQGPPQLMLAFSANNTDEEGEGDVSDAPCAYEIARRSPSNTVILSAVTKKIHSVGFDVSSTSQREAIHENSSHQIWTVLSGLPSNTHMQTFFLPCDAYTPRQGQNYVDEHFDSKFEWKLVILYVAKAFLHWLAEAFIERMQWQFPGLIVVGSDCSTAYVSVPIQKQAHFPSVSYMVKKYSADDLHHQLNVRLGGRPIPDAIRTHKQVAAHVYNEIQRKCYEIKTFDGENGGICGVAFAGDVPVRCVVSRGLESITTRDPFGVGIPRPISNFVVHESDYDDFHETNNIEDEKRDPPSHLIHSIRNVTTGEVLDWMQTKSRFHEAMYIGVRLPTEDGFLLGLMNDFLDCFCLVTKAECGSLTGAYVDFFKRDICGFLDVKDMKFCLTELRRHTSDESLLGAVMFTCNEHGSILEDDMTDAQCWAQYFPDVPCTLFDADCIEIGPTPRVGRKSIFQTGNARTHIGTAVMLLFIAPPVDSEAVRVIDDSDECISAFIHERLIHGTGFLRPGKRKCRTSTR
jgi:hypothetical protein